MERIEKDTLGEVIVEEDKLWGPNTQRACNNFEFSIFPMPMEVIYALALVKKAAAAANDILNAISHVKANLIMKIIQANWMFLML